MGLLFRYEKSNYGSHKGTFINDVKQGRGWIVYNPEAVGVQDTQCLGLSRLLNNLLKLKCNRVCKQGRS